MEENRRGLLEKTAEALDLPGEIVAGLPHIELTGSHELRMENHKGILAYGDQEIQVSGGVFLIQIRGSGLELRAMTGLELLITGRIDSIQLH